MQGTRAPACASRAAETPASACAAARDRRAGVLDGRDEATEAGRHDEARAARRLERATRGGVASHDLDRAKRFAELGDRLRGALGLPADIRRDHASRARAEARRRRRRSRSRHGRAARLGGRCARREMRCATGALAARVASRAAASRRAHRATRAASLARRERAAHLEPARSAGCVAATRRLHRVALRAFTLGRDAGHALKLDDAQRVARRTARRCSTPSTGSSVAAGRGAGGVTSSGARPAVRVGTSPYGETCGTALEHRREHAAQSDAHPSCRCADEGRDRVRHHVRGLRRGERNERRVGVGRRRRPGARPTATARRTRAAPTAARAFAAASARRRCRAS